MDQKEAAMHAFSALLAADYWLFVARRALGGTSGDAERDHMDKLRQLLAEQLQDLQDRVYGALTKPDKPVKRRRPAARARKQTSG